MCLGFVELGSPAIIGGILSQHNIWCQHYIPEVVWERVLRKQERGSCNQGEKWAQQAIGTNHAEAGVQRVAR